MSLGLEIILVGIDKCTASKTPSTTGFTIITINSKVGWEDFVTVVVIGEPSFCDCKNIDHRCVSKRF